MAEESSYPLGQYTTGELTRYRRELEHALQGLAETAPAGTRLQADLQLVHAEEESRRRLAEANGAAGPSGGRR